MGSRTDALKEEGNDGFALLAVLGFILLLAMVLLPFAGSSRVKLLTVSYDYERSRLGSVAEAANSYLAWRLANDEPWRQAATAGQFLPLGCSIGNLAVRISVIPHAGLINLNTAEEPLLRAGLEKIGLAATQASDVAGKIVQFRAPRPVDGEDATGVDDGFKHASFEDLTELHDFGPLRGFALADLAHVFSAQSGQAILSRSETAAMTSQYFTIETVFFDAAGWGGDAAVFLAGNRFGGSNRIVSIAMADKPARPERAGECGALFAPDVIRLLTEVLT